MAAPSPRKRTAPRKSTAARTAPKKPTNVDAFEVLRERARRTPYRLHEGAEPFVVPGVDPPVEAHWPKTLVEREAFHTAAQQMNFFAMLRVLLSREDYLRVLAVFDQYEDSGELLIGLTFEIIDHFNGPGASDAAPGGSTAS